MPPVGVSSSSSSSTTESANLFEILGEVFLDPLIKDASVLQIEVLELIRDALVLRVSRGLEAPMAESCELVPLMFENQKYGLVRYTRAKERQSAKSDQLIAATIDQLGTLFAWTSAPWSSRILCLQQISALRRRNSLFDWVGIYRRLPKSEDLLLSVYLGEPTEHCRIPLSKGICGAAIRENRILNIPNVRSDPRFIACSVNTQSELVVPIRNDRGDAVAEIDIDSNEPNAFAPERLAFVEACAQDLGKLPELF